MKSLNTKTEQGFALTSNIFIDEIITHIYAEEFEYTSNDSYCKSHDKNDEQDYEEKCYYKSVGENSPNVQNAYIFNSGIGLDVDYDCGGNMITYFWWFETYTFEQAYDNMVLEVNRK